MYTSDVNLQMDCLEITCIMAISSKRMWNIVMSSLQSELAWVGISVTQGGRYKFIWINRVTALRSTKLVSASDSYSKSLCHWICQLAAVGCHFIQMLARNSTKLAPSFSPLFIIIFINCYLDYIMPQTKFSLNSRSNWIFHYFQSKV